MPISTKPNLTVRREHPFNAETPAERLVAAMTTPTADFYVRNHGSMPEPDTATHRLSVGGMVEKPLDLDLATLEKDFERREVRALMQCAGNRRRDLLAVAPVAGDPWGPGALGNADWSGVSLADVLKAAGVKEGKGLHVAIDCLDECEMDGETFTYGVSIPLEKAMHPLTLIATGMNGEALTREHGAPMRIVAPGFAGARNAKWVRAITVQDHPSDNPIQRTEYKLFPSEITAETADPAKGMTIEPMPLNSAICIPANHANLKEGRTTVAGWAVSGSHPIARVELSLDGGRSWLQTELENDTDHPWSWTLWSIEVPLCVGDHELVARAFDAAGQTQPSLSDDTWNYKGYLENAWHRVHVVVG
ncbi:molybdopterin-dependent oxidoreductase [Pararhizobium mangrovi]|uniref:Molybdopterin oxidoreductase n=1 Tax=Pararhizobium mangrovi TaxID=2590452 RepID=A0A506TXB4_9HYPH|nr:molybdopterin-dependent oxidoreductase [Pararhizobium mangrovi]TPW25798.1 molybdopterin oxidoreductase [Pararhizobium mangrovi]